MSMQDAVAIQKTARRGAKETPDREPTRAPERTIDREINDLRARLPAGTVIALDRHGKPVYRKRGDNVDPYYIDPDIIPDGFTWAWRREMIAGMSDTPHVTALQENGWRYVMAESVPGRFMPDGYKGPVLRGGLALMECPTVLVEAARAEERQRWMGNVQATHQRFKMNLAPGMEGDHPRLPNKPVQTTIERGQRGDGYQGKGMAVDG